MTEQHSAADIVIVGAGQAAAELAGALRTQGHSGKITMIGDEPGLPYRRPPLSKACLAGEATLESLVIRQSAAWEKANVDMVMGVSVTAIDRAAKTVTLSDGRRLPYGKLALATGGHARKLTLPGADLPCLHVVRTVADIAPLQAALVAGAKLVIVGGGYIGLEVAAVARKLGVTVTVLEAAPRVLARVTAAEVSAFYERYHREKGVTIRTDARLVGFEAVGAGCKVLLEGGEAIDADAVVVGVGLVPNTELAAKAGLEVGNGIITDRHCMTSDPDIFALGDCAFTDHAFYGRSMRIESVPNALEQARVVAATLTGKDKVYDAVPWFWSDQYDLKLQMVGLSTGFEQVVFRGSPDSNSFMAFYMAEGAVIAVDSVNRAPDFTIAKKLVADRAKIAPEALADDSRPLKEVVA